MIFTKSAPKLQKIFENTITFAEKFRISGKKLGMLAKMCAITECTNWQYRLHPVLGIHYKIAKACIKLGESSLLMQAFILL